MIYMHIVLFAICLNFGLGIAHIPGTPISLSDASTAQDISCFNDFTLTENIFHAITHSLLDLFDFVSLFLPSEKQIFACRDGGREKVIAV